MNTIYFDGLCVPNPGGPMFLCVLINKQYRLDEIGNGTINLAEWSALLWALKLAQEAGINEVDLVGDSQLAVNQANGTWKTHHPTLAIFKEEYDAMASQFQQLTVRYAPRLENRAAIHLEDVLLACATIGPSADVAAQFQEHIDWPTFADVDSAIDMLSGKSRQRRRDQRAQAAGQGLRVAEVVACDASKRKVGRKSQRRSKKASTSG